MSDEELKERLRYTIDHGMFRAVEDGMSCSFSEILNRIEELEAKSLIQETFYKNRIEELEKALFWLYGQVDQAREGYGIYPEGSSMDEAMLNASKAIANVIEQHALQFKGTDAK